MQNHYSPYYTNQRPTTPGTLLVKLHRLLLLPLLSLLVILQSACSINVPIELEVSGIESESIMPAYNKVVIQIPKQIRSKVHSERGLLAVGAVNEWNLMVGQALETSLVPFFERYFDHVEIQLGGNQEECNNCSLIVRPRVEDILVSAVMMQAEITLKMDIFDSLNRPLFTFSAIGESSFFGVDRVGVGLVSLWVPLVSTVMGESVISHSAEAAFNDAYDKLGVKIENELHDGKLARVWLPKELQRKQAYGRYEFDAERIAKTKGCNLTSDGLKLSKTSGYVEYYNAYCWGQDVFQIRCEYGNCAARSTDMIVERM